MGPVTLDDIQTAKERIRGVVYETPTLPAFGLDAPDGNTLWLKAENLQRTNSFKLRGAYNAIASLDVRQRARGVVTYSSGNHGQAVACAAHLLGARAVVVMPEDAIPLKVESTRRWGAAVEFAGHTSLDRQERAEQLVREHGYEVIPPFDDPRIIAGQGTAGLEILQSVPEIQAVVVQVGGGGLVAGVSTAVKSLRPDVRVIGVEPEGAADARESLQRGELVTWSRIDTVADGLRTSRIGQLNFAAIRTHVDEIVTVTEEEILRAVGLLARDARIVAEPSGAVATAAVLSGKTRIANQRIAAVVSGGNIDPARLQACLELVSATAASV